MSIFYTMRYFITLLLILFALPGGFGQVLNGPPPTPNYSDAPLIDCYLPGYAAETTFGPIEIEPPSFCGSIENNHFMAFTAKFDFYTFTFELLDCANWEGVQVQLFGLDTYSICTGNAFSLEPMSDCYSVDPMQLNQVFTITSYQLDYNHIYYIMIDGWAGDLCNYQIIDVETQGTPPTAGPPALTGPSTVQAGSTATYSLEFPDPPFVYNPCNNMDTTMVCPPGCYLNPNQDEIIWTGPPGAIIQPIPNTYMANITFGDTSGEVCIQVNGDCLNFADCMFVEVVPPIEVFYFDIICPEEVYPFCGQWYPGPGVYECHLVNAQGIDSTVILFLEVYPVFPLVESFEICNDECVDFQGTQLCEEGGYEFFQVDQNGCEQPIFVNVTQNTAEASLPPADTLSPSNPSLTLQGFNPENSPEVVYQWTGPDIHPNNEFEPNPTITLPGWYTLEVYDPNTGCYSSAVIVIYWDSDCIPATPLPWADSCTTAPSFCASYLTGYCGSNADATADPNGNLHTLLDCTIENNQWMTFTPCEPEVSFDFFVYNCTQNSGLEFFLLESPDCETYDTLATCFSIGNGATDSFTITNLTPGTTYYLMIDGLAGDICSFEILDVEGIQSNTSVTAELHTTQPGFIDGPMTVCLAEPVAYTLVPGNCVLDTLIGASCPAQYQSLCPGPIGPLNWVYQQMLDTLWHLPPGASFLGDSTGATIQVSFSDTLGGILWVELVDPLNGSSDSLYLANNCVDFCGSLNILNNCENSWSLDIEVEYALDTLPLVELCAGECFIFCNETICESGWYTCQDSCRFVTVPIQVIPDSTVDLGLVTLCQDSCYSFLGETLCTTGSYTLIDSSSCPIYYNLTLDVLLNDTTHLGLIQLCQDSCYQFLGENYCDSGAYIVQENATCPAFYTFELAILPADTTDLGLNTICADSCFTLNGQDYCEAGTYFQVDNSANCPAWIRFDLELQEPDTVDLGLISICADSCYPFQGMDYCEAGIQEVFVAEDCGIYYFFDLVLVPHDTIDLGQIELCQGECFDLAGGSYCESGSYLILTQDSCPVYTTFELEILPIDTLDLGEQLLCEGECYAFNGVDYCEAGLYEILNTNGTCPQIIQFEVLVNPIDTTDLGVIELCLGDCFTFEGVDYCEADFYTITLIDSSGCPDVVEFTILLQPTTSLNVGPTIEICAPTYTYYTVSFDLSSEFTPFSINGQPIPGNSYTSAPIPTGLPYSFEVADANNCSDNIWVQGQYICPLLCSTEPGEMDQTLLYLCPSAPAIANYLGGEALVAGDTLEFILHTLPGDTIVDVLDRNYSGIFYFDPAAMQFEETYYISAVAGQLVNGEVDLQDPCTQVANGQPIFFYAPIEVDITGQTLLDCFQPKSILEVLIDGGSGQFEYQWLLNGQALGENPFQEVGSAGLAEVSITDLLTNCEVIGQTTILENFEAPEVSWSVQEADCEQANVLSIDNPQQHWIITWFLPDGSTIEGEKIESTLAGTYFVEVYNPTNGCLSTLYTDLQAAPPRLEAVELALQYPPCPDLAGGELIIEEIIGGTPPYDIRLNQETPVFPNSFAELLPGLYLLEVVDAKGCRLDTLIQIEAPFEYWIELGPDRQMYEGAQEELSFESNFSPGSIQWYQADQLIATNETLLTVSPPTTTTYKVVCTSPNGCLVEDRVVIEVIKGTEPGFFPNAFSPNEDGHNDRFYFQARSEVRLIEEVRIFSRWGEQLYERRQILPNDPTEGWDGTQNGQAMPQGVYVYLAVLRMEDGSSRQLSGDVTLVR